MNKQLILRMYKDHDYTVEEISQRLCILEDLVADVLNIKHLSKDNKTMIFPQLPKRVNFVTTANTVSAVTTVIDVADVQEPHVQAPSTKIREHVEFGLVIVSLVCWIVYWYGIHRGAW